MWSNAQEGIYISDSSGADVSSNTLAWNATGISVLVTQRPDRPDSSGINNYVHDNVGPGFWTDVDTRDIICEDNQFTANVEAAVLVELSNNVTVANNYIWNDGFNSAARRKPASAAG